MPATDTPELPKAELTYLDKRVMCELRDGVTILFLGLYGATSLGARTPPEFISLDAGGGSTINASLIRVTPRLVHYRQVMSEGAGKDFHAAQQ